MEIPGLTLESNNVGACLQLHLAFPITVSDHFDLRPFIGSQEVTSRITSLTN